LLDEEIIASQRSALARALRQAEAAGDTQAVGRILQQLNE